jgi:N-formylmaleamate deformylase
MKNTLAVLTLAAALGAPQPISISTVGQGSPVVFLPGLGCRAEVWSGVAAELSKDHTCVLVSIAGFGGQAADGPPDFERVTSAIAAAVRREKWEKPVLVGHSFGGYLALSLAASHPGLFPKVVLVDAYPFPLGLVRPDITPEVARQQAHAFKGMLLAMTEDQFRQQQAMMLGMSVTREDDVKRVLGWTMASDRATLAQAQSLAVGSDLRPELPRIICPVLVVGTWKGRKKLGFTREKVEQALRDQYRGLPDVRFAISDQARHFVMLDDPGWLARQIQEFLGE